METKVLKEVNGVSMIDYDQVPIVLVKLCDAYDVLNKERSELRTDIIALEVDMNRFEVSIGASVAEAIDVETGKKRYPNETARGAEVSRQLEKDDSYCRSRAFVVEKKAKLSLIEVDLDGIKLRCSNYRNILDNRFPPASAVNVQVSRDEAR